MTQQTDLETATFGGGCFWCTEAVFQQLKGVKSVVSGYSGGSVPNPSYDQVCSKRTGHAEVIQVVFDPREIRYADLLEVFFHTHDPTTLNRQGNDIGPQYRSIIFHHDDVQRLTAEQVKQQLDSSGAFSSPLVTAIEPFREFWPAEGYHQNYFASNPRQPYCSLVISPKVDKFRKAYAEKLA
ncbi:MAG: peptide-methionine (S)-S-oxide reductase MsrA [Planctomycetaceae bacterium]